MTSGLKITSLAFVLLLAACAQVAPPSRNAVASAAIGATMEEPTRIDPNQQTVLATQYDVAAVRVTVPESLEVSEANLFFPKADIVWHGEPTGDRHAQVKAIFEQAAVNATSPMIMGRAVEVDFELQRFHAVTPKARYTIGGVHNVAFLMTVRDAATGEVIDGPRKVAVDAKASGGARAIAEEEAGLTQRVVIVEMLSATLRRELSARVALQPGEALVTRAGGGVSVVPAALE